jgi:hypothetical protein
MHYCVKKLLYIVFFIERCMSINITFYVNKSSLKCRYISILQNGLYFNIPEWVILQFNFIFNNTQIIDRRRDIAQLKTGLLFYYYQRAVQ